MIKTLQDHWDEQVRQGGGGTANSNVNAVYQSHRLPKGFKVANPVTPSVTAVHGAVLNTQYDMLMAVLENRDKEIERLRKAIIDLPQMLPKMKNKLAAARIANEERDTDATYWMQKCEVIKVENEKLKSKLEEHDNKESLWKRTLEELKDV